MAHPLTYVSKTALFWPANDKKKRNGSAALGALPSARTRPEISCPLRDANGQKTDQKHVRLDGRVGDGISSYERGQIGLCVDTSGHVYVHI